MITTTFVGNKIIIKDTLIRRADEFEIVEEFPHGYVVWSIGRQNFPCKDYIPLAKPLTHNIYCIDLNTLKAIKVKDEQTALAILKEASRRGVDEKKFSTLTSRYKLR